MTDHRRDLADHFAHSGMPLLLPGMAEAVISGDGKVLQGELVPASILAVLEEMMTLKAENDRLRMVVQRLTDERVQAVDDHFAREDAHRRRACLERLAEQAPAPPDVIPVQVVRFDQPWQPDEAEQKPAKGV